MTPMPPCDALTARELQSLRNLGNECERAADEIERLRATLALEARRDALTLTDEREAFERWIVTQEFYFGDPLRRDNFSDYNVRAVENAWQGWQARAVTPAPLRDALTDERIDGLIEEFEYAVIGMTQAGSIEALQRVRSAKVAIRATLAPVVPALTALTISEQAREVKNRLCIEGHTNAALSDVMKSSEPDEIMALLTAFGHAAIDMATAAERERLRDAPSPTFNAASLAQIAAVRPDLLQAMHGVFTPAPAAQAEAGELPPMPPNVHSRNSGKFDPLFTVDQMQAYARAAVAQALQSTPPASRDRVIEVEQMIPERAAFDAWFAAATFQTMGADWHWAAWQAGAAAEREQCAKLCERELPVRCMEDAYVNSFLIAKAKEIRARERDADERDAARYRWLRSRLQIKKQQAVSGSVRDTIDVAVGCSFLDSPEPKSYPPEAFLLRAARVDAAIDDAICSRSADAKDTPNDRR